MVSFAVQSFYVELGPLFFFLIFAFILTYEDRSKKILLWFMSKCVLPVFSSGTFILSGVILRFLNHIEFIYVNIMWGNVLISLLHILSSFANTSYWRSHLFFTVHSSLPCHGLSIGVLFHVWTSTLFHLSMCLFLCQDHAVSLLCNLKSGMVIPLTLFFFLKIGLAIQNLIVPYEF